MINIISEGEEVAVPAWVLDLESFRRWIEAKDVPEKARIWYLKGEVWVDMSKEQVFSHVLVKTKLTARLTTLVEAEQLGLYLGDELPTDYDGAKRTDEAAYARLFHGLLDRGVAIAPGAYEAMFVGTAHGDELLDHVVEQAAEAARALR